MTPPPAAPDPVLASLADLVDAGHLSTEQARAAYAAGRAVPATGLRRDALAVAAGSALLATLVLLSSLYARADGQLDWSNYVLGLAGCGGLLAFAVAAWAWTEDPDRRAVLVSWPAALGAFGAGLMVRVALGDSELEVELSTLTTVLLAAAGYWLVRRSAQVVAGLAGLYFLCGTVIERSADRLELGEDRAVFISGMFVLFAFLVTLAGWMLPTRDLTAVLAGVVGLQALGMATWTAALLTAVGVMRAPAEYEQIGSMSFSSGDTAPVAALNPFDDHAWIVLLLALALCVLWAYCHRQTGYAGYRLLVLAAVLVSVPMTAISMGTQHPTYWEAALGLAGAAFLAYAGLRALSQRSRAA